MRKALIMALLLAGAAYLLFWPVPIRPLAWRAPPAPALTGRYAVNHKLADARPLAVNLGVGPADVAVDEHGNLYAGYGDGRLMRFDADGRHPHQLADTGGRPFGLDFAPDGGLIIADGQRGLLRVDPVSGEVRVLTDSADGTPLRFARDLAVAADGTVYFSDASSRFGPARHGRDILLAHRGRGRLLAYHPDSGRTRVLLSGLQFATGVALSHDERFVLVAETGNADIVRYWLKGPRAGRHDVFIDNLPGVPGGLSGNGRGTIWVALPTVRDRALEAMADKPLLRKLVFRLPAFMQPRPARRAFVLGLDERGRVTDNLQYQAEDAFSPVSGVQQAGNRLYLGSLTENRFAVYSLNRQE